MPLYECVFIARQDISANQVEGLVGEFSGIIEQNGGRIAKSEMWGLRNLAYRIKKNRKGHYALLNLDAPAAAVAEMERNMRLSEDVIRYLTVRVSQLEEGPSAIIQARQGRDDRGRGGRGGRYGGGGPRPGDRGGPRPEESSASARRDDDGSSEEKSASAKKADGESSEDKSASAKKDDGGSSEDKEAKE